MINPDFVDVEMEFHGLLDAPESEDQAFGTEWPSTLKVFHRSEWRDRIEELKEAGLYPVNNYARAYNNQSPESSCVLNAAEACFRSVRNRALGMDHEIKCSPMSVYGRVAHRRHSGYYMWKALSDVSEYGFLPESSSEYNTLPNLSQLHEFAKSTCKHTFHQNTPFTRELPEGWRETAKHFRVLEWLRIDSRDHFASALLHLYPICYGRSGHSISGQELVEHRGGFVCKYLDSYGPGRGDDGFLYDSERMWSTGGAWACRAVTLPDDPAKPAGDDGK